MSLSVDKALRKAQGHIKAGELAEAEELYKQVLSKFPKNKKAIQGYQKLKAGLTSKASSSSELRQEQADELIDLYNKGQFKKVLSKIRPLVSLFPNTIFLHNLQGASNSASNNQDAAIDCYKKVIKIKPDDADAYYNMGNSLNEKGNFDAAIESYKQALKIKPDYVEAYTNMGTVFKKMDNLEKAIDSYQKALKIDSESAETYNNLGLTLKDKGHLDAAENCYKQALKIKPNHAGAYNNFGTFFKDKGYLEAAEKCYKQALQIKPNFANAHLNLGIVLRCKGELDAALIRYKQALNLEPDNSEIIKNLLNMPFGSLAFETLDHIKNYLESCRFNAEKITDAHFIEAGYLMHTGATDAAFQKFYQANNVKALTMRKGASEEKKRYSTYLKDIINWRPSLPAMKSWGMKKIFILGPSRSGKSTLEYILSKSRKTKPLYEVSKRVDRSDMNLNVNGQLDFEKIYFENENDLLQQNYEVSTSTAPQLLYSVTYLADKLPDAYFIFVNRDQKDIAAEIYISNYTKANHYAYDPQNILEHLDFYREAAKKLEVKLPHRVINLTFEQIIEHPANALDIISSFTSIDFDFKDCDCETKRSFAHSTFRQHFQKLVNSK